MSLISKTPFFVILLFISGLLTLAPCLVTLATQDMPTTSIFFQSAIIIFAIAGTLLIAIAPKDEPTPRSDAKIISQCMFAFLTLPIGFAIPFYHLAGDMKFFDAYFEMVSALTTTGFTLYEPRALPPIGHLWRGLVGWFGGGLIWIMASKLFLNITHIRTTIHSNENLVNLHKINRIAKKFLPIYALLTLALAVVLRASGMPTLDAFMVAMATFSTSGIIATSHIDATLLAQIFIIIGLAFAFSRATITKNITTLHRDCEMQTAILLLFLFINLLWLSQLLKSFSDDAIIPLNSIHTSFFRYLFLVASFLSTTGFLTKDIITTLSANDNAPVFLIAMALCALGGGIATTAGGFKLFRLYILIDHSRREINRVIQPSYLGDRGILPRQERIKATMQAWNFMFFTLAMFVIASLALAFLGHDYKSALTLTLSALSNTGPLVKLLPPEQLDFIGISILEKSILIIAMVIGRFEILGVVAFFSLIRDK